MDQSQQRYTITAALPYTNGPIHIGHLAGVYVPADIYARFLRMQGNDVAFVSGSDEHGVAIPMKAKKEGITSQELIDKYHTIIKKSFEDFGVSFDNYSRTSSQVHHKPLQDFLRNSLMRENSLKKPLNSCMMLKQINSLLTGSSREPAQSAEMKKPTATSVKPAEVPSMLQIL
jgi:methionyl-tRNA synthetase